MMRAEKKVADVGDEKQVAKGRTKSKIARDQEIIETKELLDTYGGRSFIWRLLEQCGMRQEITIHPQAAFAGIGRQHIGRWVENEVFTSDPDAYTLMWREAQEREKDG